MDLFSEDYKSWLNWAIENIEERLQIRLELMIKKQSGFYQAYQFLWGLIFSIIYGIIIFISPIFISNYLIYSGIIVFFAIGYFVARYIKPVKRLLIAKKIKITNTEQQAISCFQKYKKAYSDNKICLFIYISAFEQKTIILMSGIEDAVVAESIKLKIAAYFQNIFFTKDISIEILEQLMNCKQVFSEYIPLNKKNNYKHSLKLPNKNIIAKQKQTMDILSDV